MDYEIVTSAAKPFDPFFGTFLHQMRESLQSTGSELGSGLMLFTLAVSTRSKRMLEIGRYTGFSTYALTSALRFLEMGWKEPDFHRQRPDVNYGAHESTEPGRLTSVEPQPLPQAEELLQHHNLLRYVELVTAASGDYTPTGEYDLIFIDGDHTYEGCLRDVVQYVPFVRPGGLFILHDYFGWYFDGKTNESPVIDHALVGFEQLLIDTGYQSLVVFRRRSTELPVG
jgi:predicted O-methyltransferase YrrM